MNIHFQEQLPTNFHDTSRVWVYQCSRSFSATEAAEVQETLQHFVATWKSHGDEVKGFARLFFHQFILLMADESGTGVSGCSTDSSVRLIKQIEQHTGVELFNRQMLAFFINEKTALLPLSQLSDAIGKNIINEDTLYFNNTVLTKRELEEKWIVPVRDSWLAKPMQSVAAAK
jgi:hypothetical protein